LSHGPKPRDIDWLLKRYLKFFSAYGLEESNIREVFDLWNTNQTEPDVCEFAMYLMQNLLNEIERQIETGLERTRKFSDVYYHMAMVQRMHQGKNGNSYFRKHFLY